MAQNIEKLIEKINIIDSKIESHKDSIKKLNLKRKEMVRIKEKEELKKTIMLIRKSGLSLEDFLDKCNEKEV